MTIFKAKGVSRIEQPEKNNYGWYVRVRYHGEIKSKFFADRKNGGRGKAFQMAKSWYKKEMKAIIKKIGGKQTEEVGVPKGVVVTVNKRNNTGVVGIQKIVRKKATKTYKAFRVSFKENGKNKTRFFSIEKYGEKKAFEMARKFRVEKLLQKDEG
ncbi:hypothetical protein B1H10_01870 [candidate division KSB1 bacterium 4484_188]|nr:MAG: hypothetical protein B1H10_01870 [candidate division KSB1 bacterium 4484_188]HFE64068.1 hypothetical protein [Caldithrix sp.]